MEIRSNFAYGQKPGIVFTMPSMTEQSHKAECEINTVIAKYKRTGVLPEIFSKISEGHYGDFSKVDDFQTAQNQIIEAQKAFEDLPVAIRRRFGYDVASMLDFVDDPANFDECVRLGIFKSREEKIQLAAPDSAIESEEKKS